MVLTLCAILCSYCVAIVTVASLTIASESIATIVSIAIATSGTVSSSEFSGWRV